MFSRLSEYDLTDCMRLAFFVLLIQMTLFKRLLIKEANQTSCISFTFLANAFLPKCLNKKNKVHQVHYHLDARVVQRCPGGLKH